MIGEEIGKYRVTRKIGAGGMGAVYRAEHMLMDKPVALKVLLPRFSNSENMVQRFFNEAKAASAIQHPGIVQILDFGFHEKHAYILMEYLEGESLRERLERMTCLPLDLALGFARQVAGALDAAHAKEIVHRDLKPDNIFLTPDPEVPGGERIKLLDFGIAKLMGENASDMKTRTGMIMGTPAYMAPEQCKGASKVDHRADIYSMGCIVYHLLCGRPPFTGEGSGEVLAKQVLEDPTPPSVYASSMPPGIEAFILRLLNKNPAERPQSAAALIEELDRAAFEYRPSGSFIGRLATNPPYAQEASRDGRGSTTLSSGAVTRDVSHHTLNETPRPRSRVWPAVFATLFVVLGLGGIALLDTGDDQGDESAANAGEVATDEGDVAAGEDDVAAGQDDVAAGQDDVAAGQDDVAAGDVAAGDGEVAKDQAEAAPLEVTIASEPPGAAVLQDGQELGRTPHTMRAPEDGSVLTLRLDGHEDGSLSWPAAQDTLDERGQVTVSLAPSPRARSREEARSGNRSRPQRRPKKPREKKVDDMGFAIID